MNDKQIFEIGKYKVELTLPDTSRDLKYSSDNNINAYDDNGHFLWNISDLLKVYSNKNGLKYYDDMYFDIRVLDNCCCRPTLSINRRELLSVNCRNICRLNDFHSAGFSYLYENSHSKTYFTA